MPAPGKTRRILLAASAAGVVLGAGRLATLEVRDAGLTAANRGLSQKAARADAERRRVILLERDLASAREESGALTADLALQRSRTEEAQAEWTQALQDIAATRSELLAVRERASIERARLQSSLQSAEALASQRLASLKALEQQAEALARERDRQLELLEERSSLLEAAEERERTLRTQADRLGEQVQDLSGALVGAQAQVTRHAETLRRLRAAGVNVDRLNGTRPMPVLAAVVVRVDEGAVPPEVLVDLGRGSGLARRDTLYLVREGQQVARLEVVEVGELVSRARVAEGDRGLRLRSGDDVRSVPPPDLPP